MERVLKAVGEVMSRSALRAVEDLLRVTGAVAGLIWRERRGRLGGEVWCGCGSWAGGGMVASIVKLGLVG